MVPRLSTFLDLTLNSLAHATGSSAGTTIACAGLGLGGGLAALSGFKLLRDWRISWVAVTGHLMSCSVEVFPGLFLGRRKIVQITYVYRYAAGGKTHEGCQTVVEKREAYFDPRKRARESMARGEIEIFHDERQPSRSRLRESGRRRVRVDIFAGSSGTRRRPFSRLRMFAGAKVALFSGLGIAALSAVALILGLSSSRPDGGVQLSSTPVGRNPASVIRAHVPGSTGVDTSDRISRAVMEEQVPASSLVSRQR
jgi:hypothetical protein